MDIISPKYLDIVSVPRALTIFPYFYFSIISFMVFFCFPALNINPTQFIAKLLIWLLSCQATARASIDPIRMLHLALCQIPITKCKHWKFCPLIPFIFDRLCTLGRKIILVFLTVLFAIILFGQRVICRTYKWRRWKKWIWCEFMILSYCLPFLSTYWQNVRLKFN